MNDRDHPPHRNRGAERSGGEFRRGNPLPRGSAARPAAMPEPFRYTMNDLVTETGITARTIRYYIQEGLLPPAHGRGPGATYDAGHLVRLRAIALLKERHLPLGQIQERLANLGEQDLVAMLEVEEAPAEDLWRRIELLPGLELHLRERGDRKDYRLLGVVEMIKMLVRDEIRPEPGAGGNR